ncbi:BrnA antitoxin family protein, partial [Lactiplantibacillus plantarum]|nr:BrnA antitoxin family protein [Lactiplantibacillus plantarum]
EKVSTTIRFDADILAAFKHAGPGWQTRMNQALRDWLAKNAT